MREVGGVSSVLGSAYKRDVILGPFERTASKRTIMVCVHVDVLVVYWCRNILEGVVVSLLSGLPPRCV